MKHTQNRVKIPTKLKIKLKARTLINKIAPKAPHLDVIFFVSMINVFLKIYPVRKMKSNIVSLFLTVHIINKGRLKIIINQEKG